MNNYKIITNNESKKLEIQTIAIAIKLLGFLLKEGQYNAPNNIVDKIALPWLQQCDSGKLTVHISNRMSIKS